MCFAAFGSAATTAGASAGGSGTFLGGMLQLAPSIIGAGSKAYASSGTASSNASLAGYQAGIASRNAELAELQAIDATNRGEDEAVRLRTQAKQLKGRQRAAYAANGVRLGEGSAAHTAASTDWVRDVDLATIRNNAARQAWGYRTQADNYRRQADAYTATGGAYSPTGAGVTSLLGSASGVASKWYDLYKGGAFGNRPPPADTGNYGSSLFSSSGLFG